MGCTREIRVKKLRNQKFLINFITSTFSVALLIYLFRDTSLDPTEGWWKQRSSGQVIILFFAVTSWLSHAVYSVYSRLRKLSSTEEDELVSFDWVDIEEV